MKPLYDGNNGFSPVSAEELALINGGAGGNIEKAIRNMSNSYGKAYNTATKSANNINKSATSTKKSSSSNNRNWTQIGADQIKTFFVDEMVHSYITKPRIFQIPNKPSFFDRDGNFL